MKTLEEEIEARLAEILPDNHQESPMGWIQYEAAKASLESGRLLLVLRRPGWFPETKSLPTKRG